MHVDKIKWYYHCKLALLIKYSYFEIMMLVLFDGFEYIVLFDGFEYIPSHDPTHVTRN